ncbi:Hypothetical protein CINCED_3A017995 [Cinara cedri]|uniref:Uncharacterized protein n=1 Tax=Cinara cedri TaxID=506608 RepID=A0A5E4M056_9HEMI|nr:Hypothetical protein CINCED_3A017995 [Cinara cedri]
MSSIRISDGCGSADSKIGPAEYYPLFRKNRVKLGSSPRYTEVWDPLPLPCYLRKVASETSKIVRTEKHSHVRFADDHQKPQSKSNKKSYNSIKPNPEKIIKIHYIHDEMGFTDIHEFNFVNDESNTEPRKPCHFKEKIIWPTVKKFPIHRLNKLINVKRVVQKSKCTIRNVLLPKPTIKIKKNIVKEKMVNPGPGHYDLPSLFGAKPMFESLICMTPKNKLKHKSGRRYLDFLVKKALQEDIPGPGNYKIPKSSIDVAAEPPNKYCQTHLAIKVVSSNLRLEDKAGIFREDLMYPTMYNIVTATKVDLREKTEHDGD